MNSEAKADQTIIITVKLKGALGVSKLSGKGYLGDSRWAIPTDTTVETLISFLSLPIALAGIVFINGQRVQKDKLIQEGELVEIFPPISGG